MSPCQDPLTVAADAKVKHVMAEFKRGCKHPIIVEKAGEKLSQLDENEVLHAYFADKRTDSSMEDLSRLTRNRLTYPFGSDIFFNVMDVAPMLQPLGTGDKSFKAPCCWRVLV